MKPRRMIPVKLDAYLPLRDVVFEAMREAILTQILRPGERLMEIELAEDMGVSRTPIREAIKKLVAEGFVTLEPRRGAYVAELSTDDVRELYEIRTGLEILACGLAAHRADQEEIEDIVRYVSKANDQLRSQNITGTVGIDIGFHDLIYKATHNERLIAMLYKISAQVYRIRASSIQLPGRKEQSLEEHRQIAEAISLRDVSLARRLAQKHIENARGAMNKYLEITLEE